MRTLYRYLRQQWPLAVLAMALAAVNQVFSLLDPLIFRYIIDDYATRFGDLTRAGFFRGVGLLLLASMGVAFISRVAKNFQDYFLNVIIQRLASAWARASTPTAWAIAWSCPIRSSRTSAAARPWASSRRCAPTWRGCSPWPSTPCS
jgi:hypothetical protein